MSLCATRVIVSFSSEIVHICNKLHVSPNGTSNPQKGPAAHFHIQKTRKCSLEPFFDCAAKGREHNVQIKEAHFENITCIVAMYNFPKARSNLSNTCFEQQHY